MAPHHRENRRARHGGARLRQVVALPGSGSVPVGGASSDGVVDLVPLCRDDLWFAGVGYRTGGGSAICAGSPVVLFGEHHHLACLGLALPRRSMIWSLRHPVLLRGDRITTSTQQGPRLRLGTDACVTHLPSVPGARRPTATAVAGDPCDDRDRSAACRRHCGAGGLLFRRASVRLIIHRHRTPDQRQPRTAPCCRQRLVEHESGAQTRQPHG